MNMVFRSCTLNRISDAQRAVRIFPFLIVFLISFTIHGQTPGNVPADLDHKTQTAIIDSVTKALNDVYVFPDVAARMEQLIRKNLKDGKYKTSTSLDEFTERLTQDFQSVSHDKHLRVRAMPPREAGSTTSPSAEEERQQRLEQYRSDNYGFKKIEMLPGNVGYLDFRYFAEAGFGEAGATAVAAMNFLAHADALIFDLRQNGGGSPSMIQLISSYLFDEPVHLNSFYVRKTDEMQQFWTQSHVEGSKMIHAPVYVLTSSFTFSGAEEFTYNLKNMKRGTIIGETTGGGAHPVDAYEFESLRVFVSLPFGRAINPITKTNWEGVGVEPDIKVPADQALFTAQIEALKTLKVTAKTEEKKQRLAWIAAGLEARRNPVTLDEKAMGDFVGGFGPRRIFLENNALYYQREGRPKFKLIPMGNDMFLVETLDYFRLKFNRDQSGRCAELVGMYDNGTTDSNKRTD